MPDWNNLTSAETLIEAFTRVCRPGSPEINQAVDYVYHCQVPPQTLSDTQKAMIRQTVSAFLQDAKSWNDMLPVCILLASAVGRYADITYGCQALKMAFDLSPDRNLRNQLFFTINSLAFKYGAQTGFDLPDMFFDQVNDWFRCLRVPQFEPQAGRCLIAMPQFLAPPHQPTADAIAKFGILRDRFGFDVAILNSAERPSRFDLPLVETSAANRLKDYENFQSLGKVFAVEDIRIFTPPHPMPTFEGYISILEFVEKWRPEFILNFGAFHLTGELLARGVKTITMPAGTELLPTRDSACDVVFHTLNDGDRDMIARYGMEAVKVIEATYNFDLPAPKRTYVREDFGLAPDDFAIAVVGVRLDAELHADNVRLLARIADLDPHIRLVFAGRVGESTKATLSAAIPPDRLRFPGMVEDVPAMYEHMNLYINPRRTGGGASAVFALAKGVPAFTLNYGHVADMIDKDFVYNSEDDLLAAVTGAFAPESYAHLQAAARAAFARISSRERMLEHILTEAGVLPRPESAAA